MIQALQHGDFGLDPLHGVGIGEHQWGEHFQRALGAGRAGGGGENFGGRADAEAVP